MSDKVICQETAAILAETFGFSAFKEGQEEVVSKLQAGRSVLAIFPTGGGKSLCYQLPALTSPGLTLVVSPLIALMKDQLDFLLGRGVLAARLDSSLSKEETLTVYRNINSGRLKLLYVSPERLGNERFIAQIRQQEVSLLAVDEAHCISEWGHNFRPDYLKIAKIARKIKACKVLALTATATPEVAADIAKAFAIAPEDMIRATCRRPNLTLNVTPTDYLSRADSLLARVRSRPPGPTIIYVTLQATAELVCAQLQAAGYEAHAYHAGLKSEERHRIQDVFMGSGQAIIVATIAFGMGIDKSDIRYVYHYNLPKSIENYAQETGRAGRDGKPAICELFACAQDVVVLENFSYGDTPDAAAVAALVRELLQQNELDFDISVYELAYRYDIRQLVIKTILTYLELEGLIESTAPFYAEYKFKPLYSSAEILAKFSPERAAFLRSIFQQAVKKRTWFSLDIDGVSRATGSPRERVVAALNYLEEQAYLNLQVSGVRLGYRIVTQVQDIEALCARLAGRFAKREEQDIARMETVMRYANSADCRANFLSVYFGELGPDCGHCDNCRGEQLPPTAPVTPLALEAAQIDKIQAVMAGNNPALGSSRKLVRFLCGLTSPASLRAGLKKHPQFGMLQAMPFQAVLASVLQLGED